MDDELRKLEKWTTDDLLVAARQVEELASHPGWKIISLMSNLQREGQTRYMASSPPRSQAEYAMAGGIVRGIDLVLGVPDRVAKIAQTRIAAEQRRLQQAE